MKKHNVGFLIFGLIVGISFVIYQSLISYQLRQIDFVPKEYFQKNKPFEESNVKIIQAVFNQPAKRLNIGFLFKRNKSAQEANFKLHFFVSNGNEMRFLATEKAGTTFSMNMDESRVLHTSVNCEWLAELRPKDNLYVWAEEISNSSTVIETIAPPFNTSSAIPILIDYSMDDYIEEHSEKGC